MALKLPSGRRPGPTAPWIPAFAGMTRRGGCPKRSAVKIATWNVNSVKVRLPHLLDYLKSAQPDVLCLQEIKCLADDFPQLELHALGYRIECIGQRAYNGVALISKEPPRHVRGGLPGAEDDEQ